MCTCAHVCASVCVHTQVCIVKVTKIYPRTLFPYFIQKVFVLFLLFSGMRHWQVEVCLFVVCLLSIRTPHCSGNQYCSKHPKSSVVWRTAELTWIQCLVIESNEEIVLRWPWRKWVCLVDEERQGFSREHCWGGPIYSWWGWVPWWLQGS